MEENQSENEKLRKQIQFLTDVIENAKYRRHDGTHAPPFHNVSARYARTGYSSSSYRPSLQETYSVKFAERNTRPIAKSFSHHWGQAFFNTSARQPKLHYGTNDTNLKPVQNWKYGVFESQRSGLPENLAQCNECETEKSKKFLSHVKPNSSKTSAIHVTNTAKFDPSKCRVINSNDTEQCLRKSNKNKEQALADKDVDSTAVKSSSNLGNLGKQQLKSNSNLLQTEIERMQSNIEDLKKSLEHKQSCKTSYVRNKRKGVIEKECQKKTSFESSCSESSLFTKGNEHRAKSEGCVKSSNSLIFKQQSYLSTKSSVPLTGKPVQINTGFSSDRHNKEEQKSASINVRDSSDVSVSNVENLTSKLDQQPCDLISLTKYKLTRLTTSPSKPLPSRSTAISSKNRVVNSVGRLNLNLKSENLLSHNQTNLHAEKSMIIPTTPAKFIKKSKYAITRLKSSNKKGSAQKKLTRSQSNTPAKFISFSKYAMKRVRRSLSDEHTCWPQFQKNTNINRITNKLEKCDPYSSQTAVRVLRSKFKMEKVQPCSNKKNWSSSSCSYRFKHRGLYHPRKYRPFIDRCQGRHYRKTRLGSSCNSYIKTGGYTYRYKGQGYPYYRKEAGRYGKHFQPHLSYSRRQTVSQRYLQRKLQLLQDNIPFNPKHRLDRRTVVPDIKTSVNFILINGMLYKSNTKSLVKADSQKVHVSKPSIGTEELQIKKLDTTNMKTVTVRGVKFKVDSGGKSLKRAHQQRLMEGKQDISTTTKPGQISRVDIGGVTYIQTKPGTLEKIGSMKSRMAATRVVNKTVHRAAAKYKKDNTKVLKKKKYCMFYNRFGKCNKKGSCTYIHDPEKVAVCTRFLRGTCKVKDCPFSHTISKDKMPVCSYFLKGVCNRDECPYLHVNVNRDADICQEFVNGYCPQGEKCKKKHILKCPEFTQTGSCSKGEKCTLQHRRVKRKQQVLDQSAVEYSKKQKLSEEGTSPLGCIKPQAKLTVGSDISTIKNASDVDSEEELPFKERKLPAYISLKSHFSKVEEDDIVVLDNEKTQNVKASMKIRPQL